MSCDGTATSERWCCGNSTDCCSTNIGVVTLKQVFEEASSRSVSSISMVSTTLLQATASMTITGEGTDKSTAKPSPHSISISVIIGIVAGAVVGLAILLAAFCIARRRSRRRLTEERSIEGSKAAGACAMSQRHELGPATKRDVQELDGMPPRELPERSMQ